MQDRTVRRVFWGGILIIALVGLSSYLTWTPDNYSAPINVKLSELTSEHKLEERGCFAQLIGDTWYIDTYTDDGGSMLITASQDQVDGNAINGARGVMFGEVKYGPDGKVTNVTIVRKPAQLIELPTIDASK